MGTMSMETGVGSVAEAMDLDNSSMLECSLTNMGWLQTIRPHGILMELEASGGRGDFPPRMVSPPGPLPGDPGYVAPPSAAAHQTVCFDDEGRRLEKPAHSYAHLICMALKASPNMKLTLNGIYKWIIDTFPFYRYANKGWKNSIRHNLSLSKAFVRTARPTNEQGKGSYWTLDPNYEEELKKAPMPNKRRNKNSGVAHDNSMTSPPNSMDSALYPMTPEGQLGSEDSFNALSPQEAMGAMNPEVAVHAKKTHTPVKMNLPFDPGCTSSPVVTENLSESFIATALMDGSHSFLNTNQLLNVSGSFLGASTLGGNLLGASGNNTLTGSTSNFFNTSASNFLNTSASNFLDLSGNRGVKHMKPAPVYQASSPEKTAPHPSALNVSNSMLSSSMNLPKTWMPKDVAMGNGMVTDAAGNPYNPNEEIEDNFDWNSMI